MFIDKARIFVQGGRGGDGCLSFRREKYIPFGGPDGGNGGPGGDLFLVTDQNMTTLLDLTYRPHFKAEDGKAGQGSNRAGKSGENLSVQVPCGTVIYSEGKMLEDLKKDRQMILVARGGRGGRGNASFKTSRNTAPRIAQKGEPGESRTLDLELKIIAEVGLIGCPNAGKSTLLSRLSQAKPKIAAYPFTTLSPNLGVAQFKEKNFVIADIPGLIEGAHSGRGLGTEFLRHIERTRILVHLIDPFGFDGKTAYKNFLAVEKELALYSKKLSKKKILTACNKMDCTGAEEHLKKFQLKLKGKKVLGISAVTGEGIPFLLTTIVKLLSAEKNESEIENEEPIPRLQRFVFENEFSVGKESGGFRVRGKKIERLFDMTNFEQDEAVSRFRNILKKMGVEKMLQKEGVQPGDTVYIGHMEFTYDMT